MKVSYRDGVWQAILVGDNGGSIIAVSSRIDHLKRPLLSLDQILQVSTNYLSKFLKIEIDKGTALLFLFEIL